MASPSKSAGSVTSNATPNKVLGGDSNWHLSYQVPVGMDLKGARVLACNHSGPDAILIDVGVSPDGTNRFFLHHSISVPPKTSFRSFPINLGPAQFLGVRMNSGVATAGAYMDATILGEV